MMKLLKAFETGINAILLCLMCVVVLLTTFDLAWMIAKGVATQPQLLLDDGRILDLFAAFLLVLIGVELLDTIKVYITQQTVRVELILSVGLVAISRKVIILDSAHLEAQSLIGIAALVLALGTSFFLVKRSQAAANVPH
ncbi:MAG TPA: phosphate-starvation-inducible PsiE family protein [Steroidobacteraceae bacterium]